MSSDFLDKTWFIADLVAGAKVVDEVSGAGGVVKLPASWRRKWPERYVVSLTQPGDLKRLPERPLALVVEHPEPDLLSECLTTECPLIIYTGRMNEDEIYQLVEQIVDYKHGICLVHRMEMFPTPPARVNLQFVEVLADVLDDVYLDGCVGWCCHTPDLELCKAAVAALSFGNTKFIFYVKPDGSKATTPEARSALTVSQFRELVEWTRQNVSCLWSDVSLDDREDRK